MHSSSLAPQMETSLESKFSAAFEQQNASSGSKSQLCNGGNLKRSSSSSTTATTTATTIATSNTESNGEKTVSFRKGNDLDSFEDLSSLFANGLFTDLVICCTGKIFKCHRVVMAAASLYIRDALSAFYNNSTDTNSSCNHNTVMILPKEIKMADMEAILRFVYDGHVEVKVDSIDTFLRSARTLNIKGLSNVNILYNNNGSASASQEAGSIEELPTRRNNGYSNKNHNSILTNGHTGMNSPPPSPPSLNSSLASLKAMATNQSSSPSPLLNGNLYHNSLAANNSTKHLNGNLNSHHLINQYRNHLSKQQRDHTLRNDPASALLAHNITPAHQSSTPKSIFNNGSLFQNNNTNSIVPSGGSRRKQRFPTNIPPLITEMLPPAAAALYHSWLGLNSEDDDEEGEDADEEKKLVIKDDSSNDCSTAGDNISNASLDIVKQPNLPLGIPLNHYNNPQVPCVIEVEADPTTFPSYCHDMNENGALLQSSNKKRRHYPKSQFPHDNVFNKKLKLPFAPGVNSIPNNLDLSINISSPLGPNAHQQPCSPADLQKKQGGIRNSALNDPKTVFGAYPNVKTAAGANPSAASPSSSTSASASGAWAGNKWKCDICNKYYGNKQTLKEHIDYFHSNREEQIFICNICNKEYTWRKSLMKHYRDIHQMRNTPALAEINRQLAVLSSAKGGPRSCSPPLSISGDSMPMPAYVSIANTSDRNSLPGGLGMGSNSDKSKSEGDFDNEDNMDNMSENLMMHMGQRAKEMTMGDEDESSDEIEIELDDNEMDNGRDEVSLNGESHNASNNHHNSSLDNDSSSINKSTNGTNEYSDADQIDNNSSPPPASSSSLSPSS